MTLPPTPPRSSAPAAAAHLGPLVRGPVLDVLDASIVTCTAVDPAQPALFQQNLQWVLSGYVLTFRDSCCSAGELRTCSDAGAYSSPAIHCSLSVSGRRRGDDGTTLVTLVSCRGSVRR